MRQVVIVFPLVLSLALASFASPARGERDDALVVTATRFVDSRRDLPLGVTLITADDIRKSASQNLAEILAQFGLLHIRDNTGSPNAQLDLRGFGITGDQNTLVLVDGVRLSENELAAAQLTSIPLESIERIEVLRGSGAVLYGGGASGGTINIITRRPAEGEARAHALGRAGGYGTTELRAGYSKQYEVLGVSLAASAEDTDGYRANNRFRQANLAGALEARLPAARAYLRFGLDDQRLRLPGALTEAQIQADPRQTAFPNDYGERHGGYAVLGGTRLQGRNEYSADLSYRRKQAEAFFAIFGGFYTDAHVDTWGFTPRAKLVFDAWQRSHELVLGLDLDRWSYDSTSASSPATLAAPFSRRAGEQTNQALYAQANLWLAAATRLVLGARVQRVDQRLAEQVFPVDDRREARTLDAYEIGLRQRLAQGWSAYAKYGKSFRVANFDENACFFPPCAAKLLEPQTSLGGELGLEYEIARLRARASLYQMRLENEIYFSPLVFANVNLAPTLRQGLELEVAWRAAPALELKGALAALDARFRSGVYGGVDVSGKDVPLVPSAIATAGVSWEFAPRSRANANLRYVGPQRYDNDQANTFARKMPEYALLDLKLEHRVQRADLALEVRNLFDKRYYSYGAWDFGSSFIAYPQPGRAAYLSVAFRAD